MKRIGQGVAVLAICAVLFGCGGGGNDSKKDVDPNDIGLNTDTTSPQDDDATLTARAGNDFTINEGEVVHLDGTASTGPDGLPLSYVWTLLSKPGGLNPVADDIQTSNPKLARISEGEYIYQLVVNDGTNSSEPDTVKFTVNNMRGRAPARDPIDAEIDLLIDFAVTTTSNLYGEREGFAVSQDPIFFIDPENSSVGVVTFYFTTNSLAEEGQEVLADCRTYWDGNGLWRNKVAKEGSSEYCSFLTGSASDDDTNNDSDSDEGAGSTDDSGSSGDDSSDDSTGDTNNDASDDSNDEPDAVDDEPIQLHRGVKIELTSPIYEGFDSSNRVHLYGEVKNIGDTDAVFVKANCRFYNAASTLVDTDYTYVIGTNVVLTRIDATTNTALKSTDSGVFEISPFLEKGEFSTYECSFSYSSARNTKDPKAKLELKNNVNVQNSSGRVRYLGEAENTGTKDLIFGQVYFVTRDTTDSIIDIDYTYIDGESVYLSSIDSTTKTALRAGAKGSFSNRTFIPFRDYGGHALLFAWEDEDIVDGVVSAAELELAAAKSKDVADYRELRNKWTDALREAYTAGQ